MNSRDEVIFDWDKIADVMYVIRQGYDASALVNMDSDKLPGIVKRIDPQTEECVGFIMHDVSKMFPVNVHTNNEQLRNWLDISLNMTNERHCLRTSR